jgi:hypothetical protein
MNIFTKRFLLSISLVSVLSFISFGPTTLSLNITGTDAKCNGNANGSAIATASGGSGSYTYTWSTGDVTAAVSNLVAGTYTVTAKDNQNNTIQGTITINQPAPLTATIDSIVVQPCFKVGGGACGCNNTLWAIVNGGTAPYQYVWTPNGQVTDTIFNVCYVMFGVTVTDKNGCKATDSLNVVLPPQNTGTDTTTTIDSTSSSAAGIANYNNFAGVKLYPVPAVNQLNINLNKPATQTRVEIYNMLGTKVMEQKVNDGISLTSLDISALADGYYFCRISGNNAQKTIRFSKNNK